jgi:hypothetical protein
MPERHWTLTDVANRVWHDRFAVSAGEEIALEGSNQWSVQKYTLRGGLSDGVDVVEIHSGRLQLAVLPTRGMGLWKGALGGLPLGWQSPVALPVNPAFVNALDRGGIGWLGGFNEWLCRCGLDANGPPGEGATLHGRVANIPAHFVELRISTEGPGIIEVTGVVDETMMFGPCLRLTSTLRIEAGAEQFTMTDQVTNLAGKPGELELLYHIQFGRPFLEPGARLVAPALEVAPRDGRAAEGIAAYDRFAGPDPNYAEQVYYHSLAAGHDGQTRVLLQNAHADKGVSLRFAPRQLPCFTLWKNTQSDADGYVAGLEPATNFPNPKSFERGKGRVVTLPPGGRFLSTLEIAVHANPQGVAEAHQEITALMKGRQTEVHQSPQAKWSPAGL